MAAQLALLAKAVVVALLGSDQLWPGSCGRVGLLYLFASICTSLLLLLAEMLAACALISGHPAASLLSTLACICMCLQAA